VGDNTARDLERRRNLEVMGMNKEQVRKKPPTPIEKKIGDVMVVGGGISGIQASLDSANSNFKVFLVDEAPAIGGHMAQLDKTFPTLDCSMCILSPKFIECDRHPNIEILTYHQIDKVEGEAGNFRVTLIKKPRYIKEDLCVGCGSCAHYCAYTLPDKFNEGLSTLKALYIPFAQAVPLVSVIDRDACLFFQRKCKICLPVCKNKAIDLYQKEKKMEVEVGAIVLSPGYDIFDPGLRADYGYGKMRNVMTSLQFERIICASGPYQGEMLRPSDRKRLKKIAWIQCVGSRQVIPGGNSYCSAVCCTYATKQVILAKDHDSEVEATVFHNDVRTFGKEFEQFYQRAESLPGVRYIRSYVSIGREIPESGNVTVRYSAGESGVKEEEFDMVVLGVGMNPPTGVERLADSVGIELNQHRFCKTNIYNPLEASRPGVLVSGTFQCPKDIPESVMDGSAAAALCGQLLAHQRGKLAADRAYPQEKDVSEEEPRVGVFVCHCGTNIASVVDIPSVVRYASTLSNVVHAEDNLFSCSADSARHISETIKEKKLNRVVVAACTPRTHEPLFQDTLREAGINKYLFTMANIREHCSWVHSGAKERATDKAKDIVRMSVARAILLSPLKEFEVPVNKKGLVIGGGLAGMISALSLAEQGFEVHLVEKNTNLGGIVQSIHSTLEGMDVQTYLTDILRKVQQNPLIHISTNSTIIGTSGFVGNFHTKVISGDKFEEIDHGITIVATGAEEHKPTEYLYGKDDRVLTLLELEQRIAEGDTKVTNARSLVMIQCVGCRDVERPYCSRICCSQTIKCALKLKKINPHMDIYIVYRDMITYGFKEDYYLEAANQEVRFIRYELDNKPQVEVVEDNNRSTLRVFTTDHVLGKRLAIDTDIVALAAAIVPSATNSEISHLFKIPLNQDGFFLEAHVKLRPVDFAADGIFLCGMAHYPKTITETISQAYGATGRAATILSKDMLSSPGVISAVDESKCIGCGICHLVCPYGAIELQDTTDGLKAKVISVLCKGEGICNSKCPTTAISLNQSSDVQISSDIKAAFCAPAEE
jgi:heterodisulfide reductase subunit A